MRMHLIILAALAVTGCTYEGNTLRDYINDPRSIIQDPHFGDYQEQRDALESQYLKKEITYADYVEKMDGLDEQYTKEVQERNAILSE